MGGNGRLAWMVGLLTDNCPGGDVPVELIWAHPGLLSDHALELLAGRVGQQNCPPFLRRCYAGLRSAADRLASGELRVRLGNGPLERLGQRAEGDLTMAATIALAGEPETYWDLSTRYVAAATSSLRDQMHEHRTGRLVLFARLAAVAVEALFREQWGTATARPPGLSDAAFAESLTCLYWSVAVYAELAAEHFMAHRDPRVFADADRRLAFLAEVTKASDETEALVDVLRRRAVLHAAAPIDLLACRTSAMGAILLATSTTTPRMPEEAGRFFTYAADLGWGLRFEGSEAGVLDLPEQDLADDAVLLANARGYLDQARRAAGGGPAGDLAGLRLHIAVRQEKTDLTAATITRLAREVLAAPEPKSPMFQFLALSRSRARRDQCVPELENFLAATPVMVARADGLRAAQWAVIEAVSLAWQVAPEYVGRLLAAAESIFPEFSPRRIVLTRLHAEYLVRGDRKLAEACLRGSRGDLSGTVDAVIELAPSVAGQHPGAVNFLLLTVAPAAALAAQLAGDADAQRQAWLYALSVACVLRYWNIAYPVFRHVLEDVTAQHGAGGAAAVRTLAGCAAVLEACLGDLATDRLQVIYRETLSHFSRSGAGIDDILLTVDLAKGHRFSGARAWLGSHGGQVSDGLALPELGPAALAPDLTGLSEDEHWLREMREATAESVPYREDLDLRRRDSQVYELPKRRFDAGIYSAAFAGGTGDPAPLTSQLENLLDDSELVLDLYLGRTPDAERAVFVTACSTRGWALTTQPIPFAIPRPVSEDEAEFFAPLTAEGIDLVNRLTGAHRRRDDVVVKAGDMVALPYAEFLTDLVRSSLLHPSGPREVLPELRKLLDTSLAQLLGPAVAVIEQHLARGGTRLIIIPHGPFRAFPFHLLYLDGQPLGQRCCVTYAPTMRSLMIPPGSARRSRLAAFAYAPGDPQAGFPELPDVTGEAAEIAAMFKVRPKAGRAATATAFLDAVERSRYVHIATHGGTDTVPSFHHLVTAPEDGSHQHGRLYAFQILDRDLRGVELVTLSACTTSLVRFDNADNPRGIVANLLLRGARFVVGALWPVRTEVARHFFVELYRGVRADQPVPDAFWAAQQATRARYPALRDWGVFALIGSR